ncbi:MAG: metallophosphoesterase family protein [Burkholderiales bacterium]
MSESCAAVVDGPLLVFGGNYSNLEATRAVLAQARRLGIGPDNVVCTGDVIAFCADPLATVETMRRSRARVLMGNCEESLGVNADDCGCGFDKGSPSDLLAAEWYAFANRMLDEDARAWMRSLPRRLHLEIGGRRLAVIHGGVQSISRYIFASTPAEVKREEIAWSGCDGVLAGHCGLPFTEIVDGRLWHNAGAIGMPANDGTARTWYSTIVPGRGGLRIEHHALDYEFVTAAKKMSQAGLSERYALALQDGLWPNCDILPRAERAQRGIALAPGRVEW